MTDRISMEQYQTMLKSITDIYRQKGMDYKDKSNLPVAMEQYDRTYDEYRAALQNVTDEAYQLLPNANLTPLIDKLIQLTYADGFAVMILGNNPAQSVSVYAMDHVIRLSDKDTVMKAFDKYTEECIEEINAKRFL